MLKHRGQHRTRVQGAWLLVFLISQVAWAEPPAGRRHLMAPPFAQERESRRFNLEGSLTPEERHQLRRDLDSLSREIYPRRPALERRLQDSRRRAVERFGQADVDGDRVLNRAEMERFAPRAARHFDHIDSDGDGRVTEQELADSFRRRQELRRERFLERSESFSD